MDALLGLSFTAVLLGAFLVILGLRGRKLDDHPICRRCGFDLVGTWPGRETCPECGAGLNQPKAVTVGAHRRGRVLLAAGMAFLLLAAGGSAVATWRWAGSVNWTPYKPVFMLLDDAGRGQPGRAYEALDEIASRIRAGKLSRARTRKLVARALDVQADRATAWNPGWGNIIEAASRLDYLTPEEEARYERQAADVRVQTWVQPRIRSGDTPTWTFGLSYEMVPVSSDGTSNSSYCRVGNPGRVVHVLYALESATLDGQPLALKEEVPGRDSVGRFHEILSLSSSWEQLGPGSIPRERVFDLPPIVAPPGPHELATVWRVQLRSTEDGGDLKAEWTTTAVSNLEIVPADRPLVELITDAAVGRSIREACIRIDATFTRARTIRTPAGLQVELWWKDKPERPVLLVDCIIRASGAEVRADDAGGSSWPGHATNRYRVNRIPDAWLSMDKVDVILKPNQEKAVQRGITEIWGEEIEFKGVPITEDR